MHLAFDSAGYLCLNGVGTRRNRGAGKWQAVAMLTIRFRRRLAFTSLALILSAGRSEAMTPETEPLRWNVPAEQAECPVGDTAVWSRYRGGRDCIRYFAAGHLEVAPFAMIIFYGDRTARARRHPTAIPNNTARAQRAYAARLSAKFGFPVIVLARPGTYGSSGNHFHRRQPAEFLALDAALDRIRERYRIGRFVLVGQSGGATAAAALLTLGRTDISCAVLTSGAYALVERAEFLRRQNGRPSRPGRDETGLLHPYDPLAHVNGIVRDRNRLIIVIGSPEDRLTPFRFQKAFADAVKAQGHRVRLIEEAAPPPLHHVLTGAGLRTAAKCATGMRETGAIIEALAPTDRAQPNVSSSTGDNNKN